MSNTQPLPNQSPNFSLGEIIARDTADIGEFEMPKAVEAANNVLKRVSGMDTKTGLPEAPAFYEKAQQILDSHREYEQGTSHVVAFLDIDDFKEINDALTHTVTDNKVLLPFVEKLRTSVREDDLIGRFGGEEFIVMLQHTKAEKAQEAVEKILKEVNSMKIEGWQKPLGFSVGIVEVHPGENIQDAVQKANTAEKYAKDHGKNQVVTWTPEIGVLPQVSLSNPG